MPVTALLPLAGNLLSAQSQTNANREQQDYDMAMYQMQRADNIELWRMQNEYNLPANQMQRLRDAGLNPNLVYGQGSPGNAPAINTPDMSRAQIRPVDYGNALTSVLPTMLGIADLDIKQAQHDNLRVQNSILQEEALLKSGQAETTQFDLQFKKDLRDTSAEYRQEELRRLRTQTDLSLNQDAREAAKLSVSTQEAAERMLNMQDQRTTSAVYRQEMRQRISNLVQDGITKELDNELRKQGINPSDPLWSRLVARFLGNVMDVRQPQDPSSMLQKMRKNFWGWIMED